jgi:hypothetical protein
MQGRLTLTAAATACGACQNAGVRVVEVRGSLKVRLVAVCLVVVGLVGMHHLIAVGCASIGASHSDSHLMYVMPAVEHDVEPSGQHGTDPSGSTGSIACLAVMVFAVSLLARRSSWVRRDPSRLLTTDRRLLGPQRSEPPDLVVLSISRT